MTPAATSIPINENSSKEVYIRTSPSFNSYLRNLTKENKAKIADVMHWLDKGIKSKGLNLEKLSGESAPFMSCRLSQDLRLILTHPTENVYIFYYAGRHDDAYTWAERHNAGLDQWGNIQCYPVPIGSKATVPNKETKTTFTSSKHKSLFEKFTNQQLLSLSVPPELLQAVRNVYTKKDLERLAVKYLPLNAHQNLIALADGITYDQILKEITSVKPAKTWEEAVQRPQVDLWTYDEKEFEKILAEPIAKWRIFLHPDQARLVTSPSRAPMLVKGAAGTGKTVAALHRAAYLVKDPGWDPSKKLLFTTFTTTLAQDIRENLKGLCTPEELERIEVNHFNNWLAEFLKSHGVEEEIVYDSKKPQGRHSFSWRKRWIEALKHNKHPGINNKFLKDEWNNYIIREGIFTEQQYLKAERKGSQKPLDKKDRRLIWPVFDTMRKLHTK